MIVDAHFDLAWGTVALGRDYRRSAAETRRLERDAPWAAQVGQAVVGLPDWRRGGVGLVFATLYAAPERLRVHEWERLSYANPDEAHRLYGEQLDLYRRIEEDHPGDFALIRSAAELAAHESSWESETSPVGLVILMEGADAIREPDEVEAWAERGVRIVAPAWGATRYAGSSKEPGRLTADGRRLLGRMADLGLILDVSHLSEAATQDAVADYEGAIIASHSNPRTLLPEVEEPERHLSDAMIRTLAERDGVIGAHLFAKFLVPGWRPGDPRPPLTTVLDHIDHVCQVTGDVRHVGIGSDLDGGFGLEGIPASLDTIADLRLIGNGLAARGFAADEVDAVLGENWLRLLRRSLP